MFWFRYGEIRMNAHDARAVGNELIRLAKSANRSLTPMQILKLAYLCHGFMLALYGRPLIKQSIEAWRYGPVIRDIYDVFKRYGGGSVAEPVEGFSEKFDPQEADLIRQVFEKYGHFSGIALSTMTHEPGSPWATTVESSGRNGQISNDLISDYFRRMIDGRQQSA